MAGAATLTDSAYLLAQDGFRAEDDLEINIKEITVVVAAIAQEEKESEQLARAIQVAIEEHQAAVQDTDALRTRAEMALNVAMQMGAMMERVAEIEAAAVEKNSIVEAEVTANAASRTAFLVVENLMKPEVHQNRKARTHGAFEKAASAGASIVKHRATLSEAMKATKEAEQKIALVRADTKRFTEEELPLLHKDQVELSAAVVEARSRAEAAKSRLREHEEQRKRTIQAVEVDSVSTAARLARAKEQAAAATSKDQVVAKATEENRARARALMDKGSELSAKTASYVTDEEALKRDAESAAAAAAELEATIAAVEARVAEVMAALSPLGTEESNDVRALSEEIAAMDRDSTMALSAESDALRKESETGKAEAEAKKAVAILHATLGFSSPPHDVNEGDKIVERMRSAVGTCEAEALEADAAATRHEQELGKCVSAKHASAESVRIATERLNKAKGSQQAAQKAKGAKEKQVSKLRPKREDGKREALAALKQMLEERARDELPKSAAAALAAATSVSREEVQRTKDDFDKVSKELNDKIEAVKLGAEKY